VLFDGIVALVLGILLLFWTGPTLLFIITLIGVYWFASGIFAMIGAFVARTGRGWKILSGVLGILAGLFIIAYPLYSAILLPAFFAIFIGVLGLVIGAVSLVQAFRGGGWGAGILGIISIIFGILVLAHPLISAVTLILIVGIFAVAGGITAIVLAFRLR
jgi:uncharacterized membrane protein HdeD (DUF308 family)